MPCSPFEFVLTYKESEGVLCRWYPSEPRLGSHEVDTICIARDIERRDNALTIVAFNSIESLIPRFSLFQFLLPPLSYKYSNGEADGDNDTESWNQRLPVLTILMRFQNAGYAIVLVSARHQDGFYIFNAFRGNIFSLYSRRLCILTALVPREWGMRPLLHVLQWEERRRSDLLSLPSPSFRLFLQ